jgi:hypothetical protein
MLKKLLPLLALPVLLAAMPTLHGEEELLPPVTIDVDAGGEISSDDLKRRVVPGSGTDEELEPQVVIRKRGDNVVEEYRLNGRLYKVKVTPAVGPAYYMVDTDGDGIMDQRFDKLGAAMSTPQWVLFSW